MKEIINVTFAGRTIPIEDSAFEKLKSYINSLRTYFGNEEGRDEIIADIESRFSELMTEKIRKGSAHITDADVDGMIAAMGRPEDFDNTAENEQEKQANAEPNFTFGGKRRLYRDESNKVIGGVCSGVANWLNIDPSIVRVIFAVITFGGFGTGFLLYIALWIFLPKQYGANRYEGKRLFRNPDDKVIGGVASGIGAYFNMNTTTIRWILAIPLILSALRSVRFFGWYDDFYLFPSVFFGSVTGTFIFVYIVLWIVLPEARSPYQKMEMRGETVDVNSIKQNVQSSMNDMKEKLENWGKEVQDSAQKLGQKVSTATQTRGPEWRREFGQAASRGSKGIGYVIAMIFKGFFLFVAGCVAISLFVGYLGFLFSGFAWEPVNNFLWTSETQQMLAWATLLLFVGAPIVGLLVWVARRILNVRTPGNYLNWMFSGLWTIGLICFIFFLASITKDFRRAEVAQTPLQIQQPGNKTLLLKVSQPQLEYESNYGWMFNDNHVNGININRDSLKIGMVGISFEKSADSLFHVILIKDALGRTDEDALARAQKIQYTVISADSVLDLPNGFSIDKNSKYRVQQVKLIVQVPVGKKIKIDASVKEKLQIGNIRFNNRHRNVSWESDDRYYGLYRYRSDVPYTMDSTGRLVSDDDIPEIISSDKADSTYRWNDGDDGNDDDNQTPVPPPAAPASPNTPKSPADTVKVYRYRAA
ncbi:MAG: PspC domain-containing protein [Niabella sp.]